FSTLWSSGFAYRVFYPEDRHCNILFVLPQRLWISCEILMNAKHDDGAMNYRSYKGLPTLAGLATLAEAVKPGLSVEACVARLKRYHYAFVRLHEIFTARITAEPVYELKTAFSHHAYLCAEHVEAIRNRVGEMREPPLGLEETPHEALQVFFDEILAA